MVGRLPLLESGGLPRSSATSPKQEHGLAAPARDRRRLMILIARARTRVFPMAVR